MVPPFSAGPMSSEIPNFSLFNPVVSAGSQCNSQAFQRNIPAPHHLSSIFIIFLPPIVSPPCPCPFTSPYSLLPHPSTSLQTKGAELIGAKHCLSAEISTRPEDNFSEEIMLLHDTKIQNVKLLITFFKSAAVWSVLCH